MQLEKINYIIQKVNKRGYNEKYAECNDFLILLEQKEFKELIALEIYEHYFLDDRHEFDLQLLRELVEQIAEYFSKPDTIMNIETGLLRTVPSAFIFSIVKHIIEKLKKKKQNNCWRKIGTNVNKIEKEFNNHNYILSDDIEKIFDASKEEIQPLLKLCGCKCYYNKNRNIWIKPGTNKQVIKQILQKHRFKNKYKNIDKIKVEKS